MNTKKRIISIVMAATCISALATFSISAEPTNDFSTFFSSSDGDVLLTEDEMIAANAEDTTDADDYNEINDIYETRATTATLPTSASNAATIGGGNMPYSVGTYNLKAGSAGYVKYTPTVNINCSVYTTGSTDTYLEIYDNVSCTSPISSNNNSGHGNNAKIYRSFKAGTTYYIKVKGATTSTSGNYTLVFHRGMPTSRSEKKSMFSTYNSDTYIKHNNCYTYALGYYKHPTTGKLFSIGGSNPGGLSGNPAYFLDLKDRDTAKAAIEEALTKDCEFIGGDWAEIEGKTQPRQGYFKVALVLAPGRDYHWYRQLPSGQWGHKPGITEAGNKDYSDKTIYYPDKCDRDATKIDPFAANYTEFLGWYELKLPEPVDTTADFNNFENEKIYPTNYELTMTDIDSLYSGMSYESAMEILGEPHDYYGSGMVGSVYQLNDGTKIIVYFRLGVIDAVTNYPTAGESTVIIK